jgi:hypothetical protein
VTELLEQIQKLKVNKKMVENTTDVKILGLDTKIALIAFAQFAISAVMLWANTPAAYTLTSFFYTLLLAFNNIVLAKIASSFKNLLESKQKELQVERDLAAQMKEELKKLKPPAQPATPP